MCSFLFNVCKLSLICIQLQLASCYHRGEENGRTERNIRRYGVRTIQRVDKIIVMYCIHTRKGKLESSRLWS